LLEWSLADGARAIRAEEAIRNLSSSDRDDDAFLKLCTIAFGEKTAQEFMYQRLLDRGMNKAQA
jgi:hypothetical protein